MSVSEKLPWYVARSSGWVAFVLIALTIVWGVIGVSRVIERRGLPRWLLAVHRHLALLAVVFTALHLAALVGDGWLHVSWAEILVPMTIDYRPGAVAWGVIAMYLLAIVQISSWLRSRMSARLWRGLHLLAYPLMWMIGVHGLKAGTDVKHGVVRVGVMIVIGLTASATIVRVLMGGGRGRRSTGRLPGETRSAAPTLVTDVPTHA